MLDNSYLFDGYLLEFSACSKYRHAIGGSHRIAGAECPNCSKPLMLHLTIDLSDPRIDIRPTNLSSLPLLYCSRCSLSWHPFCYRIVDNRRIAIQKAFRGETQWSEWYELVGVDSFEERRFELLPMPVRLQELCDELNRGKTLTSEEEAEFAFFTKRHALEECGGYPIVDVFSQIGGRSYLAQRSDDPLCDLCLKCDVQRRMRFLACLTNDESNGIRVTYDGVQIVYYYCEFCQSICVIHVV